MQAATENRNVRPLRRSATSAGGKRLRANVPARIKAGSARLSCTVTDLSGAGACLTLEGTMSSDVAIWLVIDNLPPIQATPVWRKRNRMGLKFSDDQQWVERANRDRFDPTAWLKPELGIH